MTTTKAKRFRLILTLLIIVVLSTGTLIAIKFAKGYRPNLQKGGLNGMGLLSATSYPKTAQVFVNDHLTTATDDTLYLSPGTYTIKIAKEGFSGWTKTFPISSELVSATDARLFPSLPSISPLTYNGAENISISPDGNKVLFVVKNANLADNNGVFILSMNSLTNNFLGNSQISQITDLSSYDYTKASFFWSPDNTEVLAVFLNTENDIVSSHLLNIKGFNKAKDLTDTTVKLPLVIDNWQKQISVNNNNYLKLLPEYLLDIMKNSAVNIFLSPDQEKILYTTTKDLELSTNPLESSLPSINPTQQERHLQKNRIYVFDLKEGTNYLISADEKSIKSLNPLFFLPDETKETDSTATATASTPTPTPSKSTSLPLIDQLKTLAAQTNPLLSYNLTWYPTSRHLIITSPEEIAVIEYDGNNRTTIFQTNIEGQIAIPSPDGHRLIILTDLKQKNSLSNLFSIDLK